MPTRRTRLAFSSEAAATKLPQMAKTTGNCPDAWKVSVKICWEELMNPSIPPNRKVWPRM